MKKLSLSAFLLLCAIWMFADGLIPVYLNPNSNWKSADARFGVYYWNDNELSGFSDIMAFDSPSGYYIVDIPEEATSVIFIRLASNTTKPSFADGVKWNQTGDLKLNDGNLCTITGWDHGVLTNYAATTPEKVTLTVTANYGGTIDESVNKAYYPGTPVTIQATPDYGYEFAVWSDHETTNPREIIVVSDTTISAYFRSSEKYTFTVQLQNAGCAGYEDVYLYAWDEGNNHPLGEWPGLKLESPYSYTFTNSPRVNIIWNDGGKHNKQTDDILNVYENLIYKLDCEETYTYTVKMDYFKCSAWEALYLYAWDDNDYRPLGDFPGIKLESPYTYTFENQTPLNLVWSDGTDQHKSRDFINVHDDMHVYFPCDNNFTFSLKHIDCVTWEHVYLYAWDEEKKEVLGAFPGIELEYPYIHAFESSPVLNFVVSDGTSDNKSEDIMDIYYDYSYVFPCDKSFWLTVNNVDCSEWENLYAYAWDVEGVEPLGAFPGRKLESPYSILLENVAALNFVLSDGTSEHKTEDILNIETDYVYTFTCDAPPTSVQNISNDTSVPHKFTREGQLFIQRGEKTYTVTGQQIK